MKKLVALSVCFSASTILFAASPSFSQTVTVPITGTNIGLRVNITNSANAIPASFLNTTLLTPLGAVSVSAFNGSITSVNNPTNPGSFTVAGSVITNVSGFSKFKNGTSSTTVTTFSFIGTTNGTAPFVPNSAFTNAPTTINASFSTTAFPNSAQPVEVQVPITSGSTITLPVPPVSGDFLSIGSNLQIANSTLPSSVKINPEYRQEYNNGFSSPSSSRILPLDIKYNRLNQILWV